MRSKLPSVGTTIFTVMTNLANEHGAINLSQGFPDFDVDPALISLVDKYMRLGHNQYAPMQGVPALREKISDKVRRLYGRVYDPAAEITVTSGATEAIFDAVTAVVHKGDEVIIVEPAYDSYVPAVELCGGMPVFIRMKPPYYRIDWDRVRRAVTKRTRLLMLNSPHNPTGSVLGPEDIGPLREIIGGREIFIVSDEVYEHIIFDGVSHESMSRYPDLAEKSFVIGSFGKTYHATGWKLGYCLAPEEMTREFRKVHQYVTFTTSTPVQYACAEFMGDEDYYRRLALFYQEKRDRFVRHLDGSAWKVIPSRGTYFQMLDYSDITGEDDVEFSRRLTSEIGVASIPPSVFYSGGDDGKVLRFCFAKKDETLDEAARRLCGI